MIGHPSWSAARPVRGSTIVAQLHATTSHAKRTSSARRGPPPALLPRAVAYRAALIEGHLPLVHSVARWFLPWVPDNVLVDYDDLVGYGTEGLIYAAERFDPSRGFQFSTFAGLHIRTTIQDALRALDCVSRLMRHRHTQIEQAQNTLAQQQGTEPTDAAVAQYLELTVAQVQHCRQQVSLVTVSLDQATDDETQRPPAWLDALADPDPSVDPTHGVDQSALRGFLKEATLALPPREQRVILDSYARGIGLRAIATHLGVSEQRAGQIRVRALQRLRVHLLADMGMN